MADYTAQQEQARRNQRFRKDKLKSDYDAYKDQLAQQYTLSTENLASNLEARGILKSGEAGTAVTRLAATNETNKTNAKSDYDYNRGLTRIDLLKELAALKSGQPAPATTATQTTAPVVPDPIVPVAPTTDRPVRDAVPRLPRPPVTGPRPGTVTIRPVRDAVPRAPRPIVNTPRPGTVTFNPIHPRFR